jgi:hypothetical protein
LQGQNLGQWGKGKRELFTLSTFLALDVTIDGLLYWEWDQVTVNAELRFG